MMAEVQNILQKIKIISQKKLKKESRLINPIDLQKGDRVRILEKRVVIKIEGISGIATMGLEA